jgi:NitT/TauT family transport system substrate-binding protein
MTKLLLALLLFALPAQAEEKLVALLPVSICQTQSMGSALTFIAEHKGYFAEEGLKVESVTMNNAKLCQDNALAGRSDVSFSADSQLTALVLHSAVAPMKILAQIQDGGDIAVAARRDRGIRNEADLRGKTIGYALASGSFMYTVHLLEKLGLAPADVKLSPLQAPAIPPALAGGVVDAAVIWEPWNSLAMNGLGENGYKLHDHNLFHWTFMMTATDKIIAEKPEAIRRLLRAILRAEAEIRRDPESSQQYLATVLKMDGADLAKIWTYYDNTVRLDQSLVARLHSDAEHFVRYDENFHTDSELPDFRALIVPDFLREIAPDRVTLAP